MIVAAAPVFVPQPSDAYPVLLVAVAYAGIDAGAWGVAASLAIVAVQAVSTADAAFTIVVRLASAAAIGIMCGTLRQRFVSERWALRTVNDQLRGFALRDQLTGLANRRGFEEALERETAIAARRGGRFAVVCADVDGLKEINDTHGHPGGDRVLEAFAHAVRAHLRGSDIAARVGGDEFSLILIDSDERSAREVIARVASSYREYLSRRDGPSSATVSCGVATYPTDAATADELVAAADRALYVEKRSRRPV